MINILKLGGGAGVEHSAVLCNLAERIQAGESWVLVHGASDAANTLGEQLGHPAWTITGTDGHSSRYTDPRTLEIFGMAVGSVNQHITAALNHLGVRAVGLAGPAVIRAQRKAAIRSIREGKQIVIRDDYSGRITGVDRALLKALLDASFTPVIGPLALGEVGERLNVDGDLAAASIAHALAAEVVIILSNVPGLLEDVNDHHSLIQQIDLAQINEAARFAQGRMKKKLIAAQEAGAHTFILADSRVDRPLDAALAHGGTHITSLR
jgi:[amino group carrier protein]-L-2-aminoadipate 6-kinase